MVILVFFVQNVYNFTAFFVQNVRKTIFFTNTFHAKFIRSKKDNQMCLINVKIGSLLIFFGVLP